MSKTRQILDNALMIAAHGDVRTSGTPLLFTSCCRKAVDQFAGDHPQYSLIHHTPAGKALEEANLFEHTSPYIAYLYWYLLSTRLVLENDFGNTVHFFGNIDNSNSTLFGLELPFLKATQPDIKELHNHRDGKTYPVEEWEHHTLLRNYFVHLCNLWLHGPQSTVPDQSAQILVQKFSERQDGMPVSTTDAERRFEMALKCFIVEVMSRSQQLQQFLSVPSSP